MKTLLGSVILSDGSLVSMCQPRLILSSAYKFSARDINNHPFWSGYKPERQTEIAAFVARFGQAEGRSTNTYAKQT
uniref:ribosomal protein L31 n=1 Tax=Microzonia abyssicola TaxID=217214 RepID=UPI002E788DFD|nr:ribosomal protein L31 [Syringoderma abyssicola]WBP70383.1 ribosomal protein L31 [Syringoderma abyssicola]